MKDYLLPCKSGTPAAESVKCAASGSKLSRIRRVRSCMLQPMGCSGHSVRSVNSKGWLKYR